MASQRLDVAGTSQPSPATSDPVPGPRAPDKVVYTERGERLGRRGLAACGETRRLASVVLRRLDVRQMSGPGECVSACVGCLSRARYWVRLVLHRNWRARGTTRWARAVRELSCIAAERISRAAACLVPHRLRIACLWVDPGLHPACTPAWPASPLGRCNCMHPFSPLSGFRSAYPLARRLSRTNLERPGRVRLEGPAVLAELTEFKVMHSVVEDPGPLPALAAC